MHFAIAAQSCHTKTQDSSYWKRQFFFIGKKGIFDKHAFAIIYQTRVLGLGLENMCFGLLKVELNRHLEFVWILLILLKTENLLLKTL